MEASYEHGLRPAWKPWYSLSALSVFVLCDTMARMFVPGKARNPMIRIITDSASSLPDDVVAAEGVHIISLYINEDGKEIPDRMDATSSFYDRLPSLIDHLPTSSQPSQHVFEDIFERAAQAGDEVLGVFLSSKLSGTFDGAVRAARAVKARSINFRAAIVDSASAGYDQAFAVLEAARANRAGKTLDQCVRAACDAVERSRFLFSPESLVYLQKGGRIGGAKALLGNLVKLAPVLTVRDGSPVDVAKVRTQKKALAAIVERFKEDVEHSKLVEVMVHYIGQPEKARAWAREVIEPFVGRTVPVQPVSPVIGIHVGPAMGIAYRCEHPLKGKFTHRVSSLVATV